MRTKRSLAILLIFTLLLTGCWDNRELNYLLVVSGIAVDKGILGNIRLTLTAPVPNGGTGMEIRNTSDRSLVVSEEGEDITDAYRKISMKLSRQIFLGQLQIILIGEELARDGVAKVLDFFSRHYEAPDKVFILFSKGKAADLFSAKSQLEMNIVDEIKKMKELTMGRKMQLKDFLYMMTEEGVQPIAPIIETVAAERGNPDSAPRMMSITSAAIFKKDKLIGFLNSREYRGVLWIQNRIRTGAITVAIPEEKGGGKVSGQIIRAKSKVVPKIKGNNVEIQVNINTLTDITDSSSKLDFGKPEAIDLISELFAKEVKAYAEASVTAAKKDFNDDIFGFGAAVHGNYPKQWHKQFKKNWDENFYKVSVKINSNVKIYEVGFDTKSVTKGEEEFSK
ncbi:MAG: Ger(x)C family spore germination protein [Bacillota bacterium]|nr:Ger(x)C family spore germination protein [Bacillota bacterium]